MTTTNGQHRPATALTVAPPSIEARAQQAGAIVHAGMTVQALGDVLARSGYFKDATDAAKCVVKVLAGQELGIPPVASMTGIYIVEGKPSIGATMMGALIKRSGKYDYRVVEHTERACTIEFRQRNGNGWEVISTSRYTIEDATRAGLSGKGVWRAHPRSMLFARAMSSGARAHTPDVFGGPVYTPEELGAPVEPDGEPVRTLTPSGPAAARTARSKARELLDEPPPGKAAVAEPEPAPAEPEPVAEPAAQEAPAPAPEVIREWDTAGDWMEVCRITGHERGVDVDAALREAMRLTPEATRPTSYLTASPLWRHRFLAALEAGKFDQFKATPKAAPGGFNPDDENDPRIKRL